MDKFILITGGTKGIGKAVASCLGKAGYNLILTYASDQATAEEDVYKRQYPFFRAFQESGGLDPAYP